MTSLFKKPIKMNAKHPYSFKALSALFTQGWLEIKKQGVSFFSDNFQRQCEKLYITCDLPLLDFRYWFGLFDL